MTRDHHGGGGSGCDCGPGHAYVTVDGSEPEGVCGVAHNGLAIPLALVETRWEPLLWDYVDVWRAEIPGQPDGTLVQYRIQGWSTVDPQVVHWSREQNIDRTVERPAATATPSTPLRRPAWARSRHLPRLRGPLHRCGEPVAGACRDGAVRGRHAAPASRRSWTTSPTWA
ncbi:MAG: hypothetical protein R2851_12500 [Caldilineaceae bacterium]